MDDEHDDPHMLDAADDADAYCDALDTSDDPHDADAYYETLTEE